MTNKIGPLCQYSGVSNLVNILLSVSWCQYPGPYPLILFWILLQYLVSQTDMFKVMLGSQLWHEFYMDSRFLPKMYNLFTFSHHFSYTAI